MENKLRSLISTIINEELTEMARISRKIQIGDKAKATKIKSLYADAGQFKWIADMIDVIEKSGEKGTTVAEILDNLHKEFKHNKTSQEINPKISQLSDAGVISSGELSQPTKEKSPGLGSGVRGRKTSEKTTVAKEVDQKLQADNAYKASEKEIEVLGADFIEKLRSRVKGELKRGRKADPTKAKDGMNKVLKGIMNTSDKDGDGEIDDFEEEDVLENFEIDGGKNNGRVKDENGNEVADSYLKDILDTASNIEDFVKKVNYGITNEKTSVSPDNDENLRNWYNNNKSEPLNESFKRMQNLAFGK